ncbi:MAG: hypothetical protein QGI68_08455 [Pseudomonadales bacterium]|nr:hypothetical protein [Pseudomonadales bacterium]MDP7595587.1 hypothetical protein [Pseudomonadales bacterium]
MDGRWGLTWEHRLALWLPRPLLFGGSLVAACLIAAYLSFQWFFDFGIERAPFGTILIVTCVLMFPRYFVASFDRRQYGLKLSRPANLPRDAIRRSRYAGVAGVLMIIVVWELLMASLGQDLATPWLRLQGFSAEVIISLFAGWIAGRTVYFASTGFYEIPGPQKSDIDLMNLESAYAHGRGGLRHALAYFIVVAMGGVLILPGLGSGIWVMLPLFAIHFGIGLLILLRPARDVRSLIRDVKHEELMRLEPLLRQVRDETLRGGASTQGHLTDLVTYKTQVESTPEWSFDSSTLLRFALYLLIPVASMVGGALVERVVDMVLD